MNKDNLQKMYNWIEANQNKNLNLLLNTIEDLTMIETTNVIQPIA